MRLHRSMSGQKFVICQRRASIRSASGGRRTRAMSELIPSLNQSNVLADVRRALGRSKAVKPVPLEPFIEATAEGERLDLIARFIEELIAVSASVHRANNSEEVGSLIAQICGEAKDSKVALSGSPLLREMNLPAHLAAHKITVIETGDCNADEREKLITRLANCSIGVTTIDYAIAETGTLVLTSDESQALLV